MASAARAQGGEDPAFELRRSVRTGLVSFLKAADGGTLEVPRVNRLAKPQPLDALMQYGRMFGIDDPAGQLQGQQTRTDALGFTHTTYQQVHNGVTVFSGQIKVHQDGAGRFIAVNGDFYPLPDGLDTHPEINVARAEQIARGRLVGAQPTLESSELTIVDPGWYGDAAIGPRLAWSIVLTARWPALREAFFVDARTGQVLDQWSKIHTAKSRRIFDGQELGFLPGALRRIEGDPVAGIADVDAAYDYAGDVYDYYSRAFGYDSIDNLGRNLKVTVRWSDGRTCPNAFWNGNQAAFCSGVVTDDVLGHEFQHGVTEFSANLIYQNQSGQLNESYSDVFGEVIDLFNGGASTPGTFGNNDWPQEPGRVTEPGLDTPNNLRTTCSGNQDPVYPDGVRWLLGEDAQAFGGAIRDMWDPTCHGDPDRANSPLQVCLPRDNAGVHSGSGVPNHAFAIVTDGKSYNGYDVRGIGIIKSAAVWFRALTVYMTVTTDFDDAYAALNQAAIDLIGTFPNDPRTGLASDEMFTLDDAVQVDLALQAVELNSAGLCGQNVPVLSTEEPVQCFGRSVIYQDDFEGGTNSWTVEHEGNGGSLPTPYDWVQVSDLPDGRAGTAWFIADPDIGGTLAGQSEAAVHRLISPPIQLPVQVNLPSLAFTHSMRVQPGFDGGNVRIKVNDGPWLLLPTSAFTHNPYNPFELVASDPVNNNSNMLGGQPAFTGNGREWGTSVVALQAMAGGGDTIQVRFDFGKDAAVGVDGWYVDDFEIYQCVASRDCNLNGQADEIDASMPAEPESLFLRRPALVDSRQSDADRRVTEQVYIVGDDFTVAAPKTLEAVRIWGGYVVTNAVNVVDDFTLSIHTDNAGLPGTTLYSEQSIAVTRRQTHNTVGTSTASFSEWEFILTPASPIELQPGSYFLVVVNQTFAFDDIFVWEAGPTGPTAGHVFDTVVPAQSWASDSAFDLAFELLGSPVGGDCNANLVPDDCEQPDDCNDNGMLDLCDLSASVALQSPVLSPVDALNPQGHLFYVPRLADSDVALRISASADLALGDQAIEVDINGTAVGRVFESGAGSCPAQPDQAVLQVPPEVFNAALIGNQAVITLTPTANVDAAACQGQSMATVQIDYQVQGTSQDCNDDETPDECELAGNDCNSNGIPDECDLAGNDVNNNGVPDECDECLTDVECRRPPFDDGIFCNGVPLCQAGVCVPGPVPCQGDASFCDESGETCFQCVSDADCGDGVFCNGRETCIDRICVSSGNPCPGQVCDEATRGCVGCAGNAECDDGLFCNGAEQCAGGSCSAGAAPCGALVCDEAADTCVECEQDADCDDSVFCNGAESCSAGACQGGPDPCPDSPCDEASQQCLECAINADCDDGTFCNGVERCQGGQCVAGELPCVEGECCDEERSSCGTCPCETAADCDDNDECTQDSCSVGQCRYVAIARCGDADGDGVDDEDDACADTARGDAVDAEGCSCAQLDDDGDGVDDCDDICPNTSEGGSVDGQGCLCSQRDDDSDGVDNCGDACPGTAVGQAVAADGCAPVQLDDDRDGVTNTADACPATPVGEISDAAGCSLSQRQARGTDVGAPVTSVEDGQDPGGSRSSGSSACGLLGMLNLLLLTAGLAVWKGRGSSR
ncbi:MAG: M4 family metallopeptidase [Phycisphaerae bacterium]